MVIEVKNVYKSFKNVQAVKGINLDIHQGQFIALLGPNGAGKTTLVEMIEGIQKPDAGEILLMGKPWKGNEDELHHILGLSLQETRYIDKLTVKETLLLFASFYELSEDRVNEIIGLIDLQEKQNAYVVNLSGGQRQKLALGISLINNPKILILDEPTTGLDPNARREVWNILHKLKKQRHTSLILTTHYMEEAEQLCDYIVLIDHGTILKQGSLDQLLDEKQGNKLVEFTLEETDNSAEPFKNFSNFSVDWDSFNKKGILQLNEMETGLPEFFKYLKQNGLRLKNMEFRRKTLDDLFVSLTGRRLDE
ncbi:MAG TPA: ABC transporter ATP-binding protein [Caldithrix sp.]|nr:ABC transporter ATP-binding protein [Calditrichaceae bacterium]HEM49095.1 ABC transporter ATP-binding protein [Caldithrix sp.]HES59491.1 ABC transporter ATP-binding protein [Caldithrix sp.]